MSETGFQPPGRIPDDKIDWPLVGWTLLAAGGVIAAFWVGVFMLGAALVGWVT